MSLLDEPSTFTKLLSETTFSRATLSRHLRDLCEGQIIEKAVVNNRVVYRTALNEQRLMEEIKRISFDGILSFISLISKDLATLVETTIRFIVKGIIHFKQIELVEDRTPSPAEMEEFYKKLDVRELMPSELEKIKKQEEMRKILDLMKKIGFIGRET